MTEIVQEVQTLDRLVDSPLGIDAYLTALESEQAYRSTLDQVLTQTRRRLDLPVSQAPSLPSAAEVRALFARYQQAAPTRQKRLAQVVVEMREE